jgi:hypothetical protein
MLSLSTIDMSRHDRTGSVQGQEAWSGPGTWLVLLSSNGRDSLLRTTHKQMNAPDRINLPDIQSRLDTRNTAIDAVGINGVRHPMTILTGTGSLPTIATLSMTVGLAPTTKGTHMSRFIELLEMQREPMSVSHFRQMTFV